MDPPIASSPCTSSWRQLERELLHSWWESIQSAPLPVICSSSGSPHPVGPGQSLPWSPTCSSSSPRSTPLCPRLHSPARSAPGTTNRSCSPARRQRTSLLRHYLRARGLPPAVVREAYVWYWIAAASNALAGALRYHLQRAMRVGDSSPRRQAEAIRAVRDYLRAIELADLLWRHEVVPEVVMIIKGTHTAGSVAPLDDGQAGIVGTEGLPARGADTAERAEDLADHTRMGDDDDPLAAMFGS